MEFSLVHFLDGKRSNPFQQRYGCEEKKVEPTLLSWWKSKRARARKAFLPNAIIRRPKKKTHIQLLLCVGMQFKYEIIRER